MDKTVNQMKAAVAGLLKQQVADIVVNDFGMPELVPAEFGGTAEG